MNKNNAAIRESGFRTACRRWFRIFRLFLCCIAIMVAASVSRLFVFSWRKCRLGVWWTQRWAAAVARILGMKITIYGRIPSGSGHLVVSNHLGYLDVIAHASILPIRFAPKAEIRRWPFFGWMTSLSSPIWIDRRNPRMSAVYAEQFRLTIRHGISMLVYPEGTSTDGDHGILPFKSTPFASAIAAGAKILPTLLFYPENAAWHDETPFGKHLWRVLGMKKLDIDIYILDEITVPENSDRKTLAAAVHQTMEKEYWKIEQPSVE